MRRDNKYEQTLNRHFEAWQYQESLAKVSCQEIYTRPGMDANRFDRSRLVHEQYSILPTPTVDALLKSKDRVPTCPRGCLPNARSARC